MLYYFRQNGSARDPFAYADRGTVDEPEDDA